MRQSVRLLFFHASTTAPIWIKFGVEVVQNLEWI